MRRILVLVGLTLAVVLASCGKSSEVALPPTTTTTSTTFPGPSLEPLTSTPTTPTTLPVVTSTTLRPTTTTTHAVVTTTTTAVTTTTAPHPAVSSTTSTPASGTSTTTTSTPTGPITGFWAQSASFATANVGYVLGLVGCPKHACLAVEHTGNGGITWHADKAPPTTLSSATSGTAGVGALRFADGRDGWAYGPALWATHNGALSWSRVRLGGAVDAVASSGGIAYALVNPCTSGLECSAPERLWRSPVGRNAWTSVLLPIHVPAGEAQLVAAGTTAFVLTVGTTSTILAVTPKRVVALPAQCAAPPAGYANAITPVSLAASSPLNLTLACAGDPGAGSSLKEVFVSHNGGRTFARLANPPMTGDGAVVVMPNSATVLVQSTSAASSIFRLAAPGVAWSTPLVLSDGGIGMTDLTFADPLHGAFVDGPAFDALRVGGEASRTPYLGQLYLTDDGGLAWHAVTVPT